MGIHTGPSLAQNKSAILVDIEKYYEPTLHLSIFIIGSIGNSLIIVYFVKRQKHGLKKMSSYHFLIIQLAIADLLVSICVPMFNYMAPPNLNEFLCKIHHIVVMGLSTVSCVILVVLSYERHRAIVYPFKPKPTKLKIQILCMLIWILFLSVFIIYSIKNMFLDGRCLFFSRSRTSDRDDDCNICRLFWSYIPHDIFQLQNW